MGFAALAPDCARNAAPDMLEAGTRDVQRILPRDCGLVSSNPPVFSWTEMVDRDAHQPWQFELRDASGRLMASQTSAHPRLMLQTQALPAGPYQWSVSYTTVDHRKRSSRMRRFTLASDAHAVAIPDGKALAARIAAKPHPRMLAGLPGAKLLALAHQADYQAAFGALQKMADSAAAQAQPLSLAGGTVDAGLGARGSELAQAQSQVNFKQLSAKERHFIEAAGLMWQCGGNSRYRDAAKAHLHQIVQWSPTGPTSESKQDQANREIVLGLALGLDLVGDQLDETERRNVLMALRARLDQLLRSFDQLDRWPYDPHTITASEYAVQALLLLAGMPEFPEAADMLARSWDTFVPVLNTWGDEAGGYGDSNTYAWYELDTLPPTLAAARAIGGVDLAALPYVAKLGSFYLAFTAPGANAMEAFGDDTEEDRNFFNYAYDGFRLYATLAGQAPYEWYWRQHPKALSMPDYVSPWHLILGALDKSHVTAVAPSGNAFVFEDAGVVALHSRTADPARTSLFFRSSAFGSINHNAADQNAFTLVSRGRNLLVSGGYYPYYNSPHHGTVTRATRFKNALTFDGGIGQAEPSAHPTQPGKPVFSRDASGQLLNFHDGAVWSVATGDATLAYRGRDPASGAWTPLLSNAVRTVAYHRQQRLFVVYDWATSDKPRLWELNFNALSPFNGQGNSVQIEHLGARACLMVIGPSGAFGLSSGFPVAPESPRPPAYQARFTATLARTELDAVTLIWEDCQNYPVHVNLKGSRAEIRLRPQDAPLVMEQRGVMVPATTP